MYVCSTLGLSQLAGFVAFAAFASAQDDSPYAASVLSAVINVDTAALASASANLENSVMSALAEPTADADAIISNVESDIYAVIQTLDQFTATADPALLSSIEAQATAAGLDLDFESDLSQLTAEADGPEETASAGDISTTDVDPEETSSVVVISAATSTATGSEETPASSDSAASSSSSESTTSQADNTSASSSSAAQTSTQRASSSSDSATAASTSDNIAAAATSLPIAAVGAGLALLAML